MAPLASVYAAIWLTNPPAAVITSYALAVLFLAICIFARFLQPLVMGAAGPTGDGTGAGTKDGPGDGAGAGACGFLPGSGSARAEIGKYRAATSGGLHYDQSFLFSSTLDPEHDLFNLEASATAVRTIALAGIGAVISHRRLAGATNLSDSTEALSSGASRATARRRQTCRVDINVHTRGSVHVPDFPDQQRGLALRAEAGLRAIPVAVAFRAGRKPAHFLGDAFAGDRRAAPVRGAPGLRRGSKIADWLPKRFAARSVTPRPWWPWCWWVAGRRWRRTRGGSRGRAGNTGRD